MRRGSVLKWIAITAISLAVVFTVSTIVRDASVSAAIQQNQTPTEGALRALDKEGKPLGECPLKHTEVKAQVSGFLSRVTVTQDFENTFPNKIEAVYIFPLPAVAAVDDLTMVIGERIIKGKILRRQEAKATYDAAKQAGMVASLLNQENANVFTQQIANILPGQSIRITISYVETLQYEDGSYEWTFPMVVAPRYMPAATESQTATQSNVALPVVPEGVRAGHDISLEMDLDTGVPIAAIKSQTHETEVQQIDEHHAVVRLKDRNTIPNKDFVLNYRVAGDSINDAVLTHRSERGGFFTLILQPPQRVVAEDVMPKELVFVLDTSGSMSGFPIEKAKETMTLALSTLNPHDTFNLITFSGDTEILFPAPVPATPQNLHKAKTFLASQQGNGGTEMMKAIKAALDPSDSQHHVRIACFMTDGQVGNEVEIIAEVQKHANARVFAMGFGPAPNRYLLDKMSTYGRGEVNYVPEVGDTSAVARRFNDRVRSPLLTDISIEWGSLPVTDVYPKRIPDLFSARPLVVSGRYEKGGKGSIWLKGKMAGQDVVREIPVELPETETDHDVLATLWARSRIEDLVGEDIANAQNTPAQEQTREEITQLGLEFKLMTKYTSFVAVDDTVFTGSDDPVRVDVPVQAQASISGIVSYVTVTSTGSALQTGVATLGNSVSQRSIQDLPIQGRSFVGLMTLTPGVNRAGPNTTLASVNGQRPASNQFQVDGVSANFGFLGGLGPSASGNAPALTASGGANGISAIDATQEVRIQTSATQAEQGRVAGGQVEVVTKSGTNAFHGSLFHIFGNDALDASDWFANSRGLNQPAKRLNSFGGTLGGPIRKDHTFFFASYEGLRLRQPMVGITDVPSLTSRAAATPAIRPFMEAFPVPNGPSKPDGFAEFASSFANPAEHDAVSFSVDHSFTATTMLRGRYSFANSDATQRAPNGLSLNTTNRIHTRSQTITGSVSHTLSPSIVLDLRANYSHFRVNELYGLDEFGGAVLPAVDSAFSSIAFDLNSRNAAWMFGNELANRQRQFNLVGSMNIVSGNHSLKFGGDYRRLSPAIDFTSSESNAFFDGVRQALTGVADRVNSLNFAYPQHPVFNSLSLFAQDEWRQSKRLTLNYGVRWELAPPPSTDDQAFAVNQVNDPATIKLASPGSSLWKTTFLNFGPRAGFAYQFLNPNTDELVLRGGVGIVYDLGQDASGDIFANSIPFVSGASAFNSPFPVSLLSSASPGTLPLMAFDPRLKLPYIVNWNVTLQYSLGSSQSLSAAYVGSTGKRLLHTETLFNQNPDFNFLRLITNRGNSDYRALQVQFERRITDGFGASVFYTWSRSMDNVTEDSSRRVVMASLNPANDRGPSDFDVRHQLTGLVSYAIPAPLSRGMGNKLLRNWAIDSIFNARSARPLNVVYLIPTSFGVAYLRPGIVDGNSLYVFDPDVAGGRTLNPAAFVIPADLQQGSLSRNSLRGFPFYQVDLALRRKFNFSEAVGLQIQADAFNLFNHPNFEDPLGSDLVVKDSSLAFGQSTSMSGRSLSGGGFPSFYSVGGPRAMRITVKLLF